ncbi:RNA polymerase II mediator complex subunit [Sporothrix eucalyptigena]|uniref:Mediator of RNA polymerase II transcription subunit 10 n=1 Tax=Sporothrix eucalyptigena TaxID=1812306 RepID=A0ABP0BIE8_9PEZI
MAPIGHSATAQAETAIRDTIQSLYNVMLHTSAYDAAGPHTSLDALVAEVRILSQALRDVNEVATQDGPLSLDSPAGLTLPSIPRDLVQYVEAGRNPDIYTREFVELVRRTNQLRAGKRGAFAQFRDTLAGQIRSALPELSGDVDKIMGAVDEGAGDTAIAAKTATSSAPPMATTTTTTGAGSGVASRSASPHDTPSGSEGNGNAGGSAATTIDMLGILPSTPQPSAATGAAGGAATAGGATSAEGGTGGQDSMETS